jgi:TonB family protein
MRAPVLIALCLALSLTAFGQLTAPTPEQRLDPRAILALASTRYNFSDPNLKPFRLKVTYQLYGDNDKPTERGIFEYWWAPLNRYFSKYRLSWSRPSTAYTGWYLANGEYTYESKGEPLNLFEYKLQAMLLAPMPRPAYFEQSQFGERQLRVVEEEASFDDSGGHCLTVIPNPPQAATPERAGKGSYATYCFDEKSTKLLSVYYPQERVLARFADVAQTQGKGLPRQLDIYDGKRKLLTAKIETIDVIDASDPAFTPGGAATRAQVGNAGNGYPNLISVSPGVASTLLLKKLTPIYPAEAKKERIEGDVVLYGTLGTDGKTHFLRVVSAPSASLAASAFWSVSQWEYMPYELNGRKAPVDTTIKITFSLEGSPP